jgi:hypothetical protein
MAFGRVAGPAVVRAFDTVLAQDYVPGSLPDNSLLLALLEAFGITQENTPGEHASFLPS